MKQELMVSLKKKEILFYISYIIFLVAVFLPNTVLYDGTSTDFLLKMIRYASYAILFMHILYANKFNISQMMVFGFFIVVCFFLLKDADHTPIFIVFYAFAAKEISINKLLKLNLWYFAIQNTLLFLLSIIGVIENVRAFYIERTRYCLGFRHPNNAALYFWLLFVLYVTVKGEKLKNRHIFFWSILSVIVYWFTDSRTFIIMTSLTIIILLMRDSIIEVLKKFMLARLLLSLSAILFTIINVVLAINYSSLGRLSILDLLLSGRIRLSNLAYTKYGINLTGRRLEWDYTLGQNYLVVDSSYARNLLELGIIIYILILVCYFYCTWISLKKKEYYLAICIFLVTVYSNMEILLISLGTNPFLICMVAIVVQDGYSLVQKRRKLSVRL